MKRHKKSRRQPFAYTQYLLLRVLYACYGLVPARKAYDWGFAVAAKLYPLFAKRRRVAIENILQSGVTDDPENAERIARHAFGHLAGHLCEAFKVGGVITAENWREHIIFDGPEESWQLMLQTPDTPIMILTGHHGVWEVAISVISLSRPMIAVARNMNNPFIDRFLKETHFRGDIMIVQKNQGLTANVLRAWRKRKAAMTIVMDQHAGPRHGIQIDFMGRPAYTHTSPARLHISSRAPIIVGSFIRESAFRYRMVADKPIYYTHDVDRERHTKNLLIEFNNRLAALIRRFPEQYLWAHNRWR